MMGKCEETCGDGEEGSRAHVCGGRCCRDEAGAYGEMGWGRCSGHMTWVATSGDH